MLTLLSACLPPFKYVHHGHGQRLGVHAADVFIERHFRLDGRRLGHGERHAQNRVGAQLGLVFRAVQFDHCLVYSDLIQRPHALDLFRDIGVDVLHCLGDALAEIAFLVAIAQLHRLKCTRGSPRRHCRASYRAALQRNLNLDRGIAPRIQYFTANDFLDCKHTCISFLIIFICQRGEPSPLQVRHSYGASSIITILHCKANQIDP